MSSGPGRASAGARPVRVMSTSWSVGSTGAGIQVALWVVLLLVSASVQPVGGCAVIESPWPAVAVEPTVKVTVSPSVSTARSTLVGSSLSRV